MSDKVEISRAKLKSLVFDSLELDSLTAAGVDNWEGYGETDTVEDERVEAYLEAILRDDK